MQPSFIRRESLRIRFLCVAVCPAILVCVLAAGAAAQETPPAQQPKLPHPITTVEVHDSVRGAFVSDVITAGTIDGASLAETPLAASIVTREVMADQGARVLSDVVKNDASIGEDYAPVGYYGDFEIRGFPIDLATGLQINGMTIAGEQDVPLENKERVELVKGIAGVESGVASAGGLIDFVTKRPVAVKAIDLATDHRGTTYGGVDLGRLFGRGKQVGARVNLDGERIASYVHGANGWRAVGAGAADWKLSTHALLKTDFEYQHKVERSVSGYQLLGGATLPDLHRLSPSTMLGYQGWAKPNVFDTMNTGARLDVDLGRGWRAVVDGSYSRSLIDDNVAYAYGCYYEAQCDGSGTGIGAPPWFFAPDGTYDVYDYRNPGELRFDTVGRVLAMGSVKIAGITHDIALGGELFHRNVDLPGMAPAGAAPNVQNGAVYTYVGSENIYAPLAPLLIESPRQQAGPVQLADFDHQTSAIVQDRITLPGRVRLVAGGRYTSLRDFNVTSGAEGVWLPQYAAMWNPVRSVTLYGNYGVLLSLGPQAPFWAGGLYLAPFFTRQAEAGAKYAPNQRLLITAALFRMHAPFFYPQPQTLSFLSDGREVHDGVELNAEGQAARWLKLTASGAAISAISSGSSTPQFNGKQVINVPRERATMFAEVTVPHARGLVLMPGWSYTARKEATRDDAVSVPGYNLFNLGARYTPHGENGRTTLRVYADNVGDKRYWKDTGASYGDSFVHLGAPTTVRMSAHYRF